MNGNNDAWRAWFREHRQDLDRLEPTPNNWNAIHRQIRPSVPILMFWKIAAVLFFCVSTVLAVLLVRDPAYDRTLVEEFSQSESYYQQQLSQRVTWLEEQSGSPWQSAESRQLQAMYEVLREQWNKNPSVPLRDALLLNLILRLEAAERELDRLQQALDAAY